MLQGLLTVASFFLAMGLVHLGYGKAGMEARKTLDMSSKGITFLWFFYLLVFTIAVGICAPISAMEGDQTALIIFICGMIPCIIWVIWARRRARKLVADAEEYWQSLQREAEQNRKAAEEAKLAKELAEKEKRERERALQESIARQKQVVRNGDRESLADFVEVASQYKKVADIRTAWNAWPKDGIDKLLQEEVQKRLDHLGGQEAIYGASERRTNELINELRGLAGL